MSKPGQIYMTDSAGNLVLVTDLEHEFKTVAKEKFNLTQVKSFLEEYEYENGHFANDIAAIMFQLTRPK